MGLRNRSFYRVYETVYRALMVRLFRKPVPAKIPQETTLESAVDEAFAVAARAGAAALEAKSGLAREMADEAQQPSAMEAAKLFDAVVDSWTQMTKSRKPNNKPCAVWHLDVYALPS